VTHIRQRVREGIKGALDGLEFENVYTNRVKDIDESKLPAAVIITDDERSQRADKSGTLERTISAMVVVIIKGDTDTLDDELDAWAEAIEPRLQKVPPALKLTLTATSLDLQSDEDGQHWFGYLALEYEATAFG